jgi:hypothetical protein
MPMVFALHKKGYIPKCTIRIIVAEMIVNQRIIETQRGYDFLGILYYIASNISDTIRQILDEDDFCVRA